MCRLFGMISQKPSEVSYWFFDAKIPFKEFSLKKINRGPHNSGWGVGWLQNKKWKIFKEGKINVKKYNFSIIKKIKSKLILIHLRDASVGNESPKNAHPLIYKNWIFEHNGEIDRKSLIKFLDKKFVDKLTSDTDSEVLFFLIMQFLENTKNITKAIKKALKLAMKYKYNLLNFLMSDGEKIYAFRYFNTKEKDRFNYSFLYFLPKKNKVIFSSDALDDEDWTPIKLGELVIVDKNLKISKIKL